jgi:hypothetical protein
MLFLPCAEVSRTYANMITGRGRMSGRFYQARLALVKEFYTIPANGLPQWFQILPMELDSHATKMRSLLLHSYVFTNHSVPLLLLVVFRLNRFVASLGSNSSFFYFTFYLCICAHRQGVYWSV